MKRVILEGKTRKGKNRVHELGTAWLIDQVRDRVAFAPSEQGPWLMVFPESCRENCQSTLCNHARWIHGQNDKDFTVTSAGEVADATKCLVEQITKEVS